MFTGIIEDLGEVRSISTSVYGARAEIRSPTITEDVQIGESIAVNGVCLTVKGFEADVFSTDLSPETLKTTNLGSLKAKDKVNLERSVRAADRLGGHYVLGHVDQVGYVREKRTQGNSIIFKISAPHETAAYLVPKGPITIDGISLTVAETSGDIFTVVVIPHTLEVTTLGRVKVGAPVNLEVDMIAKYVKKIMDETGRPSSTLGLLYRHGYLD